MLTVASGTATGTLFYWNNKKQNNLGNTIEATVQEIGERRRPGMPRVIAWTVGTRAHEHTLTYNEISGNTSKVHKAVSDFEKKQK